MQNYEECFRSVKKDCFKFISSQETPNEKFKNKQKMIEKFLVPVCFWISKKIRKNNTTFIGLSGLNSPHIFTSTLNIALAICLSLILISAITTSLYRKNS